MRKMLKWTVATLILVSLAGAVSPALPTDVLKAQDVLRSPSDAGPAAIDDEPSEAEIRGLLVKESITRYTGSCACPYHRKWNEKIFRFPNNSRYRPTVRCGNDSEYIRPGGPTVFCYGSDVPVEMVEAYREHLRSTFLTEPVPKF